MPLIVDVVTTHEIRLLAAGLLDPAREREIMTIEQIDPHAKAQVAAICLGKGDGPPSGGIPRKAPLERR